MLIAPQSRYSNIFLIYSYYSQTGNNPITYKKENKYIRVHLCNAIFSIHEWHSNNYRRKKLLDRSTKVSWNSGILIFHLHSREQIDIF